jgi:hypothetical protein
MISKSEHHAEESYEAKLKRRRRDIFVEPTATNHSLRNPNGVQSFSPRVGEPASLPWVQRPPVINPEGVVSPSLRIIRNGMLLSE